MYFSSGIRIIVFALSYRMRVEKGVQVYYSDILRGEGMSGACLDHLGKKHLGFRLSRSAFPTLPVPQGPAYH